MIRRSPLVAVVALALVLMGPTFSANAQEPLPNSMAALGKIPDAGKTQVC